MGVEITVDGVYVPKIPVPFMDSHDGAEWITKAAEFGWYTPSSWGEMGWDLGHWPLMSVMLYDLEQDIMFALLTYFEGDMELKIFATRGKRDRAVTEIAVGWWRGGFVPGAERPAGVGVAASSSRPVPRVS
jgi:hypothetical protein